MIFLIQGSHTKTLKGIKKKFITRNNLEKRFKKRFLNLTEREIKEGYSKLKENEVKKKKEKIKEEK